MACHLLYTQQHSHTTYFPATLLPDVADSLKLLINKDYTIFSKTIQSREKPIKV